MKFSFKAILQHFFLCMFCMPNNGTFSVEVKIKKLQNFKILLLGKIPKNTFLIFIFFCKCKVFHPYHFDGIRNYLLY